MGKQVGPLKNKQQLIKALQKAAGEELAEKAKQEAVNAAERRYARLNPAEYSLVNGLRFTSAAKRRQVQTLVSWFYSNDQ